MIASVTMDTEEVDSVVKVRCDSELLYIVDTYNNSIDINECTSGTHSCVNAECQNSNGRYSCLCEYGFFQNNSSDNQSACSKLIHLYFRSPCRLCI